MFHLIGAELSPRRPRLPNRFEAFNRLGRFLVCAWLFTGLATARAESLPAIGLEVSGLSADERTALAARLALLTRRPIVDAGHATATMARDWLAYRVDESLVTLTFRDSEGKITKRLLALPNEGVADVLATLGANLLRDHDAALFTDVPGATTPPELAQPAPEPSEPAPLRGGSGLLVSGAVGLGTPFIADFQLGPTLAVGYGWGWFALELNGSYTVGIESGAMGQQWTATGLARLRGFPNGIVHPEVTMGAGAISYTTRQVGSSSLSWGTNAVFVTTLGLSVSPMERMDLFLAAELLVAVPRGDGPHAAHASHLFLKLGARAWFL